MYLFPLVVRPLKATDHLTFSNATTNFLYVNPLQIGLLMVT